ncbi:MAG: glycosyl transferase [Flavobacteriaceae bacterium]|nr:MAG: glycosyl transferase [Flavobacteriaceae bacterium]
MGAKKKIAVIGTVGLPAKYGGFETLAAHLVKNLDRKYKITVYCSGKKYKKINNQRQTYYRFARLKYLPFKANGIQSIIYDTLSIIHALFYADVLLVLGVAGAWILPFVKTFTNKKIIISIDGIEWKRDKWNFFAKCYLFWAENLAVKYSHIDISDNESIQDYTAIRYGSLSRIIEYGADHTMKVVPVYEDRQEFPFLNKPYAFKVCRIEPENNVHEVLKAFSQLTKYTLVMVGNWENSEYGRGLKQQYEKRASIILLDPIYEQSRLDLLRSNALVYIHGHAAGGTNPSLVEAMYLGLPVIAYGVSYNRTTTEDKALYFKNHKDLIGLIKNTTIKELKAQGSIMGEIAKRRYNWELVSDKYSQLITEALMVKDKVAVKPRLAQLGVTKLIEMNLGHLKHQHLFFEKE